MSASYTNASVAEMPDGTFVQEAPFIQERRGPQQSRRFGAVGTASASSTGSVVSASAAKGAAIDHHTVKDIEPVGFTGSVPTGHKFMKGFHHPDDKYAQAFGRCIAAGCDACIGDLDVTVGCPFVKDLRAASPKRRDRDGQPVGRDSSQPGAAAAAS